MKRIIAIRHGQSESNERGIIQGNINNSGLTEKGRVDIKDVVIQNIDELSKANRIVSSPYKRAIETSEIIANKIGVPITISEKIIEFNSGVLAGNTHQYNAKVYPEFYKIWLERKDLDKIPGAEKGNELQARALSFLMEYYDKEEFIDIVVSHAGFLRCLINTSSGLPRNTAVDSRNGAINIIDDPFNNLKIERKDRAMSSKVFVVKTLEDKYVVKLKNRGLLPEDYEEKRILDRIQTDLENTPVVLSLIGNNQSSSKVLKFVKGDTIFGVLDKTSEEALIEKFCKMREVLEGIESKVYNQNDIFAEIEELEAKAKNNYVKKYGQSILKDRVNKLKLEASKYSLIHNDLNRDNILFEKCKNGKVEANIVDWEGLGLYPRDYQLASFLTSSILLEGYSVNETIRIARQIEPCLDEDFITYLMMCRIFKGLYFFAEDRNIYTRSNKSVAEKILKKYFSAGEILNKYRIDHNFINKDEEIQDVVPSSIINHSDKRKI